MHPLLSILIVSYNCADDLRQCLHSIQRETVRTSYEIIVVDNASHDDTAAMLQRDFPDVRLLINTENTGFARANNRALAGARGVYILYLNPDTVILNGAIDTMVDYMERRPGIGLLGPHTYNADRRTTQFTVYADHRLITVFHEQIPLFKYLIRPALVDAYRPAATGPVETLRGSCALVRGELVRAIGGLDERYFMYSEDYELCRAVRERGFQVVYLREASIVHSEGRSTRPTSSLSDPRPALDVERYRSLVRYLQLRRPETSLPMLRIILLAGCLWRLALFTAVAPLLASRRANARVHRRMLLARLRWLTHEYSKEIAGG